MDGMRISELSARSGVPTSTLRIDRYSPTFDLTVTAPEAAGMIADLLPTTGSAAR